MAKRETWDVIFDEVFQVEFDEYDEAVQDKILARAGLLRQFGPNLPRPYADTLAGSKFANMKELRAPVGKHVWRIAYAFDPARRHFVMRGEQRRKQKQEVLRRVDCKGRREVWQVQVASEPQW